MKIAIVSGHTLSGPVEGTVAIKSEALEARKIVSRLTDMCKLDAEAEVIDCTIDSAVDDNTYVAAVSDKVNAANADICFIIEFGHSDYHTLSGSFIYGNVDNMEESILLKHYMERNGYTVQFNQIQSKLMEGSIKTPKVILFKVCCIDSWKDMEKYNDLKIAEYIYSSLIKKVSGPSRWKIEVDGTTRFYDKSNTPVIGVRVIDKVPYYFDADGILQYGFIELGDMDWMYADKKTGRLYKQEWIMNFMQIYYADENYKIALPNPANKDELATRTIDGITYTFDKNGCIENEKHRINGDSIISFYIAENGKVYPYIWGLDTVKTVYEPRKENES